jgi:hypothetical protein
MFTKIWLINALMALMALMAVFFGFKAYGVWVQGNNGFDIPEMTQKLAQRIPKPAEALHKRNIPPETKYKVLMSLNLFAPERTELIPKAVKPDKASIKLSAADQKKVKQYLNNLTLYGLVITNDSAEALVSHPVDKPVLRSTITSMPSNRKRNIKRVTAKQTKWIKAGDTLGDFKVVSIKPDRVLFKAGDQSYDLLLDDKEQLKKRGPAKPQAGPNVVGVSAKPKTGSQMLDGTQTPKGVSQAGGSATKPPVLNAKGKSSIPLPTQKKTTDGAVPKKR